MIERRAMADAECFAWQRSAKTGSRVSNRGQSIRSRRELLPRTRRASGYARCEMRARMEVGPTKREAMRISNHVVKLLLLPPALSPPFLLGGSRHWRSRAMVETDRSANHEWYFYSSIVFILRVDYGYMWEKNMTKGGAGTIDKSQVLFQTIPNPEVGRPYLQTSLPRVCDKLK